MEATARSAGFRSILFERPEEEESALGDRPEPAFFADLNLDQVLEAMLRGREEYGLEPFFSAPLRDVGSVRYRHEALRDLERPAVRAAVDGFARAMREMREHLAVRDEKIHWELQKQRWFLDAVAIYCRAVGSLAHELEAAEPSSRALRWLLAYLAEKAVELAKATGARLTALAVEGRLPAYAATIGEVEEVKREKDSFFERLAASAQALAARDGVELEVEVRPGHAAELIVRYAREHDLDLVVVGHKGHFLEDYLLGSTADRVAHHAHCPVMIVK